MPKTPIVRIEFIVEGTYVNCYMCQCDGAERILLSSMHFGVVGKDKKIDNAWRAMMLEHVKSVVMFVERAEEGDVTIEEEEQRVHQ